jgi:hypothetical protein
MHFKQRRQHNKIPSPAQYIQAAQPGKIGDGECRMEHGNLSQQKYPTGKSVRLAVFSLQVE